METLEFSGNQIGLIVRGKTARTQSPDLMAQHADVILSDGSPMGFYGEGEAYSGKHSGFGSSMRSGLNMRGVVFDYELLQRFRPYYVDVALARKYSVPSGLLIIAVTKEQAQRFDAFWLALKTHGPKLFNIVGYNCSTRAAEGFNKAGIMASGIRGLDSPNNLFQQIMRSRSDKINDYYGFVGFVPKADNKGFVVEIESSSK